MFKNILLVTDNAIHSLHAAREAGNMARAMNASQFCVAIIYPPIPRFLGETMVESVAIARITESEATAQAMCKELGHLPCKVDVEILEGSNHAIPDLCETRHFDLIAMAAPSLGTFAHLFHSDLTEKVVHKAKCPVLVVR